MKLRTRKQKEGPELELIESFLQFKKFTFNEKLEYTILREVYAEIGIPDILIIAWDKSLSCEWCLERENLTLIDIKIIHYISSFKKRGVLKNTLSVQLGYVDKLIEKSLIKLMAADLIMIKGSRVIIKDFESKFFIRQIITIEAKINNWKTAIKQAKLNENFSSHSYILLPNNTIPRIESSFLEGNIGVISHSKNKVIFKKRARKGQLPKSYFSWILNEYIGKTFIKTTN